MSENLSYLDCWIKVATSLFSQALAGEPSLVDSLPKPMPAGSFGFAVMIEGDEEGRFAVVLDGALAEAALLGEGTDQKAAWAELFRETVDAASGELLAKAGRKCQVKALPPTTGENKLSRAFQLKAGDRSWLIQVNSEVKPAQVAKPAKNAASRPSVDAAPPRPARTSNSEPTRSDPAHAGNFSPTTAAPSGLSPGLALLLDVELEASLRFGAREMPLGEILDLGPGDVVQLDRHVNDPVDLIVGDKIVARGEVVLVNGNFGLRVTEVAEPQKRLESIRCLF
jgi:flagellar motor switch protein FliN/FliY